MYVSCDLRPGGGGREATTVGSAAFACPSMVIEAVAGGRGYRGRAVCVTGIGGSVACMQLR